MLTRETMGEEPALMFTLSTSETSSSARFHILTDFVASLRRFYYARFLPVS